MTQHEANNLLIALKRIATEELVRDGDYETAYKLLRVIAADAVKSVG